MDPYQRYLRLKDTIKSLEEDTRSRNYGWFMLHNSILQEYYDAFEDFEIINPEFDSDEFRTKMRDLNILLYKLMKDYKNYQWFGLYDYLRFNKILLSAIEDVNSVDNSELADILSTMDLCGETN